MKARLLGFVLELGKGITLDEFIEALMELRDAEVQFSGFKRLLYIAEKGDYYVGLFLTIKDQRKVCEIKNDQGEYVVSVRSLADGSNLVDFNFFVLNKSSQKGLYQHYHNSCSINQFGIFAKRQYDDLKHSKIAYALKESGGDEASAKDKRAANKKYKGSLKLEIMVRQEALQDLLDEFESINYFDFDVACYSVGEAAFAPVAGVVKKESHRIRFTPGASTDSVRRTIVQAVRSLGIGKGKVAGKDGQDIEKYLRLVDQPDFFGHFEYEDIADETVLKLDQVEQSPFFDHMFAAINANKVLFE